jgi:hypothetical protein
MYTDLARCVQVSKAWYNGFSPALWRDLDCSKAFPHIDTLTRQWEHVRAVRNIDMKRIGPILAQLPCANMQRLDFTENNGYAGVRPDQLQVLQVLERIPSLRHLQIKLALD